MRWRRKFDGNNSLSQYVGTRTSGLVRPSLDLLEAFSSLVFPPLNVCGLKLLTTLLVALLLFGLACRTRLHLFLQALVLAPHCHIDQDMSEASFNTASVNRYGVHVTNS